MHTPTKRLIGSETANLMLESSHMEAEPMQTPFWLIPMETPFLVNLHEILTNSITHFEVL